MLNKNTILMIDDDEELCHFVKTSLESENIHVETRNEVDKGIYVLLSSNIDLVLLDVVMPRINGIEAAPAIRRIKPYMPIMFLTSQSDIQSKLEGFRAGADDYITKPFIVSELIMRIKAVLRRTAGVSVQHDAGEKTEYTIGKFRFDYRIRKLFSGEEDEKSLSIKEADLLKILCDNYGTYVKREAILTYVWGKIDDYATNSMDVYVSRVRKLLKDDETIKIENLHGTGYRILM